MKLFLLFELICKGNIFFVILFVAWCSSKEMGNCERIAEKNEIESFIKKMSGGDQKASSKEN